MNNGPYFTLIYLLPTRPVEFINGHFYCLGDIFDYYLGDILDTVTKSLQEIDLLLTRTVSANEDTPTATLRQWRADLVRTSVSVSYAISVLSLDIDVLNHSLTSSSGDVLKALVDDLPGILASGWVGGGWSLSPGALTPIDAEFDLDKEEGLLDLHTEMVTSDLSDHNVVGDLLARAKQERTVLFKVKGLLEDRISRIQEVVRKQYASGVASIDDWLTGS